jgi:hypothetical protein
MIEFLTHMPADTVIIYHNGSSGFGGNADNAETADLGVSITCPYYECPKTRWPSRLVATAAEDPP